MKELTERQREALLEIQDFIGFYGFPPSRQELTKIMGWASTNAAQTMIGALIKKGYVAVEEGKNRSLKVIKMVKRQRQEGKGE